MRRPMELAPKFSLPDLTTETIGIIGKRGSGKSHTATLLVEELLAIESQVIVIDPIGGWWGLRAGANGKSEDGFPIPIFGGLHGDIPLEEKSGALLADYLVENRLSSVLDLSDFSKSAMRRFVRDFADRFYLLKNKRRDPVQVVIDECDLFVPQRVDSPEMLPLVGAINDFVRRGRQRGIGVTLISQRPAVIAKDVLTQVEILCTFRLTGPQDIKAFGEWIEHNGTKEEQKQVLATLSSLERGTGWFWAPSLGLLKQVSFRARHTYDSSRTPDGKKVKPPKTLRDVDLGQLSEAMRTTVEQAKSNDPKALKAEIARLKKEIGSRDALIVKSEPKGVPAIDKKDIVRLEKSIERAEALYSFETSFIKELKSHRDWLSKIIDTWSNRAQPIVTEIGNLTTALKKASGASVAEKDARAASARTSRFGNGASTQTATSRPAPAPQSKKSADPQRSNGEVKVPRSFVAAVAQFGDKGVTRSQITQVTGAKGSTRNAYFQRGRNAGLFEEFGDRHRITREGRDWLGDDYEELPTGEALLEHWLKKLPSPEAKVLSLLAQNYPREFTREEIGEALADERWATSSRNAYVQRLVRRELAEEVSRGRVRMAEMLA